MSVENSLGNEESRESRVAAADSFQELYEVVDPETKEMVEKLRGEAKGINRTAVGGALRKLVAYELATKGRAVEDKVEELILKELEQGNS